jgi:hypothetical protein
MPTLKTMQCDGTWYLKNKAGKVLLQLCFLNWHTANPEASLWVPELIQGNQAGPIKPLRTI